MTSVSGKSCSVLTRKYSRSRSKGTVEELQERFYSNMSSRAVEMMKEEMDFMGQVKLKDVNEAQRQVIETLRELDEEGVVSLGGSGGGDDEYVS